MGDRTQLIEDCNEMIEVLDNSKELEDKITTLSNKMEASRSFSITEKK